MKKTRHLRRFRVNGLRISYCASTPVPRHLRGSASDDYHGRQYVQYSRLVIIEDLHLKIQLGCQVECLSLSYGHTAIIV